MSSTACPANKSCSCVLPPGKTKSMCGYTEGPYVYPCYSGCCSQDCETVRGDLTDKTFREAPPKSFFERFDEFRTNLRSKMFGDMPTGPVLLIFVLVIVIILALANMLKADRPSFGRNGRR